MTDADRLFMRFPEFIREYIYSHAWESFRDVQLFAADVIFNTDNDLLLTSSTAGGKTEAAFFPILTDMVHNPPKSIGVLYIAPLKSLINDQFGRMEQLLEQSGIAVTHWHGDVAASRKKKLLETPGGILQITPESLEAMLINRPNDISRIFSQLRYVIIDELHAFMGSDRGAQILCQLSRIQGAIGSIPRRIGLSATIGEPQAAARWLGAGTGRETSVFKSSDERIRWRLGMEHFYIQDKRFEQVSGAGAGIADGTALLDAGYEYTYECVRDKRTIVFSNSREETEYVCATLRQIAAKRHERDIFLIHHGNLSAALREEAEAKLRNEEEQAVVCATVTMELGIDVGALERIVHIDAPNSVSSFLQRLGRSGRRGQPSEMMLVFREEEPLPNAPLPQLIPWGLIRAIAVVQLYIEERFIEPPSCKRKPYSLLFHQTLSTLATHGELSAARLAQTVLAYPPFEAVTREDYKQLLVSMLNGDFLELTEEKTLIIGLAAERLLNSYKFYAVFNDSEDFTVRCESEEIGTVTVPPPAGDRFALAGRVWEVLETDVARHLVYVKGVEGKMEISWPGESGEIHTRILERMRRVLAEDTVYPYLKENARQRLDVARRTARNTGMCDKYAVHLGGYTYCLFPWLGTRSFRTLRKMLSAVAPSLGISGIDFEGCCYMTFRMERADERALIERLYTVFGGGRCSPLSLVAPQELPTFERYDEYVPAELLRQAYAEDRLNVAEASARICDMAHGKMPN